MRYERTFSRSTYVGWLVTTKGKANEYGVESVIHVSRLAALEFNDYKLLECSPPDLHDRNLRIDDKIFHLGTGTDAAGRFPTNFTPAANGPQDHTVFNGIISKGKVVT